MAGTSSPRRVAREPMHASTVSAGSLTRTPLPGRPLPPQAEIKSIIRKRREFEYRLQAANPVLVDYLQAVTYEINLDALRRQRKRQRGGSRARRRNACSSLLSRAPHAGSHPGKRRQRARVSAADHPHL